MWRRAVGDNTQEESATDDVQVWDEALRGMRRPSIARALKRHRMSRVNTTPQMVTRNMLMHSHLACVLAASNKDQWDLALCRSRWKLFGHLARIPGEWSPAQESTKTRVVPVDDSESVGSG